MKELKRIEDSKKENLTKELVICGVAIPWAYLSWVVSFGIMIGLVVAFVQHMNE